jgi:hypothetical protein
MWSKGHITLERSDEYRHLMYNRQPLTDAELIAWREQGYTHEHFTGMMYDSKNPMPSWVVDIAQKIGLDNCGFVFYKMETGNIMPVHVDHYRQYCNVFNVNRNKVWRAVVFLEDWKSGHYFEIDGVAICNYRAGEYILWSADTPHAASNIGTLDRYTLQITGTLDV